MTKQGAAGLILIAFLLVAVALTGAEARLNAVRHNAADAPMANVRVVTVRRDAHGGYYELEKEKAAAPPAPELSCSKVHGVQAGETCSSVAEGSGLEQDAFLAFNPNINCEDLFVGQWVCLKAKSA